ncbi:GNAT family N-acetyltransferase [Herbaspirillum sp.]|uniref:GNAT family N-acetyltransferase n=1 Tax=Herbaspirillum sp. TaxID=1890675 RepID=UPI0031DB45AE
MYIRRAELKDSESILEWRNDPVTRTMSISQDAILKESHDRWYASALSNPRHQIFIAEVDGKAIGMCRLNVSGETAEVSINICPSCRGSGVGTKFLDLVIKQTNFGRYVAQIKAENLASIRTFESLGFKRKGEENGLLIYEANGSTSLGLDQD